MESRLISDFFDSPMVQSSDVRERREPTEYDDAGHVETQRKTDYIYRTMIAGTVAPPRQTVTHLTAVAGQRSLAA